MKSPTKHGTRCSHHRPHDTHTVPRNFSRLSLFSPRPDQPRPLLVAFNTSIHPPTKPSLHHQRRDNHRASTSTQSLSTHNKPTPHPRISLSSVPVVNPVALSDAPSTGPGFTSCPIQRRSPLPLVCLPCSRPPPPPPSTSHHGAPLPRPRPRYARTVKEQHN